MSGILTFPQLIPTLTSWQSILFGLILLVLLVQRDLNLLIVHVKFDFIFGVLVIAGHGSWYADRNFRFWTIGYFVLSESRFLTRYFCINSDPTTRRKVAAVWLATAFASSVFPRMEEQNKSIFSCYGICVFLSFGRGSRQALLQAMHSLATIIQVYPFSILGKSMFSQSRTNEFKKQGLGRLTRNWRKRMSQAWHHRPQYFANCRRRKFQIAKNHVWIKTTII